MDAFLVIAAESGPFGLVGMGLGLFAFAWALTIPFRLRSPLAATAPLLALLANAAVGTRHALATLPDRGAYAPDQFAYALARSVTSGVSLPGLTALFAAPALFVTLLAARAPGGGPASLRLVAAFAAALAVGAALPFHDLDFLHTTGPTAFLGGCTLLFGLRTAWLVARPPLADKGDTSGDAHVAMGAMLVLVAALVAMYTLAEAQFVGFHSSRYGGGTGTQRLDALHAHTTTLTTIAGAQVALASLPLLHAARAHRRGFAALLLLAAAAALFATSPLPWIAQMRTAYGAG